MNIERVGNILRASKLDQEITAVNATAFREQVEAALSGEIREIEIDLSGIRFVDSSGLGALFAIYRAAVNGRKGCEPALRILNPRPPIRQLFELTQLDQLFELRDTEPPQRRP